MNYPVDNIDDAYNACEPDEPLQAGDGRYLDLTGVRGEDNLGKIIAQRVIRARMKNQHHQQLVTGHRGCGKSTELRQLQARLERERYFVIYFDVEDYLDLQEITYQDILLCIAKQTEESLRQRGVKLDEKLLQKLYDWFAEKVSTIETVRAEESDIEAGGEITAELPLLAKLFGKLTANIHSGSSKKEEIRRVLEKDLREFINHLNLLLQAATLKIHAQSYQDLLVIVDGVEKMHYRELEDGQSSHAALFVHHSEQLKAPACHIIYTVPISLAFNANLGDVFADATFVMPMVKYQSPLGRQRLTELVAKCIDIHKVFAEAELLNQLIDMSGGAVRDLMRLVRMACEGDGDKITPASVERAIRVFVREFDRLLQKDDVAVLKEVARDKLAVPDAKDARYARAYIYVWCMNTKTANVGPICIRRCARSAG